MSLGFLSEEVFSSGDWYYFEKAVARYLIHKGWQNVELVGGPGDKGADILATRRNADYVIQVKFSSSNSNLSVDIVGDVIKAMKFYDIQKGLCISNRMLGASQKNKMETYTNSGWDIKSFTSGKLLKSFERMNKWTTDDRKPYNYQVECLSELKASFPEKGKGLISLATGMGKTFVACNFVRWLIENNEGLNILILAHRESLIDQFEQSLWRSLPKTISTHLLSGTHKPYYDGGVLLSTFDSFPSWHEKNREMLFDIVIVDEAHHTKAPTYEQVIKLTNPIFTLGLTATPYRSDRRSITDIFGPPLVYYDVATAIKQKYLCEVDYKLRNDNIDHDWVTRNSNKGYTMKHLNKKLFIPQRDEEVCSVFMDYWRNERRKSGIIFCQKVKHAKSIEKIMRVEHSMPCFSLTNKNDRRENIRILRQFRRGEIKILTVYDMLNEGVDVPDIDIIAFMRVTHSRTYFLQQLGRGLRFQRGKKLLVLDFVSDLRRLKAVQRLRNEYYAVEDGDEIMTLEEGFKLEFDNQNHIDFLNLVVQDVETEFLEENDLVHLAQN